MPYLKLPDLGENITAGDVVNILVSVGDTVQKDQPVVELETDKAVIEVPADSAGKVTEILISVGDKVGVGQALLALSDSGGSGSEGASPTAPPSSPPDPVHGSAELGVSAPPPHARDQAPPPPAGVAPAGVDGRPSGGGDSLPASAAAVAAAAGELLRPGGAPPVEGHLGSVPPPATRIPRASPGVPAAPSVRRLARELGLDIATVKGSGPGGRISHDDVKAEARNLIEASSTTAGPAAGPGPSSPAPSLPDFSRWGPIDRQAMTNVRRVTAVAMQRAWLQIPHVTQHDQADITDLEDLRKRYSKRVEARGAKLTPTAIVLKVVASALKVFPKFNASIDMTAREVIYKQYCHLGVAVDTPRGLLVPVIRDADQKNMITIAKELGDLAERARAGKLALADMQGGTFTVTNLGGIGGTSFTPIVNWPEVAILGIARSQRVPVHDGREFVPRLMMPLSLSYDHRIIDGADAARFLRWVAEALERPFVVLLES